MVKEKPTRVALVSDTHSFISPEVLSVAKSCDVAVHAGDICGAHILEALRECVDHVIAVAGNNDLPTMWAEDEHDTVHALPRTAELQLPGGLMAVEHGHLHGWTTPEHASLRAAHPNARVVVYGHTHRMVIDESTTPWVVNPGAAGRVRTNGGASCLVLTAGEDAWEIESFRF